MKLLAPSLILFSIALAPALRAGDGETQGYPERPTYRIVKLGDRDGAENSANSINDESLHAGYTGAPDGQSRRAALWFHGFRSDLEGLGGLNSNIPWPVKNRIGLIAGIAQTDIPEPLGQTWSCRSFFAFATRRGFICSAVVWENGEIRELPTLGGHNGFATAANNHRQIVGWAQNTTLDPSCNPLHVRQQFRAVLWGPGENQKRELPPLEGDTTTAATAINDRGQIVGISGDCGTAVGGTSAREAVMWEKGRIRVLGNLGGVAWNTPMALNERGDVVGFSNVSKESGATPDWRAFLWTKERGIQDLGALEGYPRSQALGINENRYIVGTSCTPDFEACRAVIWLPGKLRPIDLNDLAPGNEDVLYAANDINDAGEIAGQAFTPGAGKFTAIRALPKRSHHGDESQYALETTAPHVPLPAAIREVLLQQFGLEGGAIQHRL